MCQFKQVFWPSKKKIKNKKVTRLKPMNDLFLIVACGMWHHVYVRIHTFSKLIKFRFLKIGILFLFLSINLAEASLELDWIWSCNGRSKLERGSWGLIRRRRHGRSNLSPRNASFEAPNPKLVQFCIGLCSRRLGHSLLLQGLLSQSRRPSLSCSAPQTPTSLSVPFSLSSVWLLEKQTETSIAVSCFSDNQPNEDRISAPDVALPCDNSGAFSFT